MLQSMCCVYKSISMVLTSLAPYNTIYSLFSYISTKILQNNQLK